MNKERFEAVKNMVKEKFEVEEEDVVELENGPGRNDYVIFNGSLGRMKLEGISRPVVEDTQIIAAKRIGSESVEKRVYSDTEEVFTFKAYRWDDDLNDWQEIEAENLDFE